MKDSKDLISWNIINEIDTALAVYFLTFQNFYLYAARGRENEKIFLPRPYLFKMLFQNYNYLKQVENFIVFSN